MSPSDFVRCNECRTLNEANALFCSRCGAALYGRSPSGSLYRRRRVTLAGALKGLALLFILAATTFILYAVVQRALATEEEVDPYAGMAGTTATIPSTDSQGSSGGTSPAEAVSLVRPTSVDASSILEATSTNSYRATNLVDGDLATAWNEGAEGVGLGESVKFEFSRQLVLARIEIANGFQKDEDRFAGNPRVETLKVEYSSGTVQLVDLLDMEDYQTILPTRQPVEWVKMTIVSVHPDYDWEDTALSEVRFFVRAND